MRTSLSLTFLAFFLLLSPATAEELTLPSPDGALQATILTGKEARIVLSLHGRELLTISQPAVITRKHGGLSLADSPQVSSRSFDLLHQPVVRVKSAEIRDHANELLLDYGSHALRVRVYNEGFAYRFETDFPGLLTIENEEVALSAAVDLPCWFPQEESFLSHSERLYRNSRPIELERGAFCSLPMLLDVGDGAKIAVTESDLRDYAGMYLQADGMGGFTGLWPEAAAEERQTRDRTVEVSKRTGYLARTEGERSFPWRIFAVSRNDADLITNQLVWLLGPELELEETGWIRPGKVAWDWYNFNNIRGVDFPAGVNTATYEYYIDFAADHGIEYIILDEGWSDPADLFSINPEMDMEALFAHAKERGVGIILWVVWKTLDDQLERALDQFEQWGAAGIKVDFMQRDDQWMVNYYWRIAKAAGEREMLVDFHGSYKPAGLRRAYPNVLTREGVKGLENNKWSKMPTPEHDATLPFIRMLAGPLDYTPGAMRNAHEKNFKANFERPMSLGTRCHQLALYVILESPLQMLADSPSNYLEEPECMEFLSAVPVEWDETVVLEAAVGDYLVLARRNGENWYLGAITDDEQRELELPLSFLGSGRFSLTAWRDGVNAGRHAEDFKRVERAVLASDSLRIDLSAGGGYAAIIRPLP